MDFGKIRGPRWSLRPFEGSTLQLGSTGAPNAFHRFMQYVLLGIVWERVDEVGNPIKRAPWYRRLLYSLRDLWA